MIYLADSEKIVKARVNVLGGSKDELLGVYDRLLLKENYNIVRSTTVEGHLFSLPQSDLGPGRPIYYERVGFNPRGQKPIYRRQELMNKYLQLVLLAYEALSKDYNYQQDLGAMFSKNIPNRIKTLKEAQASVGRFDYLTKTDPEFNIFITDVLPYLDFVFSEKDVMSFPTLELRLGSSDCARQIIELGRKNVEILRLTKRLPEGMLEE